MLLENGRPRTGVAAAGAPVVFVGAPGDYVLGGEGNKHFSFIFELVFPMWLYLHEIHEI